MSDKRETPAFPTVAGQTVYSHGMTLRDWFATHAPRAPDWWWLSEECPTPPPGWSEGDGPSAWERAENEWRMSRITGWAWHYADAMIVARQKDAPHD